MTFLVGILAKIDSLSRWVDKLDFFNLVARVYQEKTTLRQQSAI